MSPKAIYFDLGGVIVRTEFQAPRQHLAERLGMEYEDLIKLVFEGDTARQASIGLISEDEHWAALMRRLPSTSATAEICGALQRGPTNGASPLTAAK